MIKVFNIKKVKENPEDDEEIESQLSSIDEYSQDEKQEIPVNQNGRPKQSGFLVQNPK
jgi:hypothetical protein